MGGASRDGTGLSVGVKGRVEIPGEGAREGDSVIHVHTLYKHMHTYVHVHVYIYIC